MTKIYSEKLFTKDVRDRSPERKTKVAFSFYSDPKTKKYFDELATIEVSAMTPIRTPICITLDLSGSMSNLFQKIKFLFTHLTEELMTVSRSTRQYTLIIMVINNSEPELSYIGDLEDFNCKEFVASLPKPYGRTPLYKSFCMADAILKELYTTLETNKHWYTVPVFFTITDCEENGSLDDCTEAVKKYTKDIQEGKKLFIEFITKRNPSGFNLGGYKIPIDGSDSKILLNLFVDALKTASSTNVRMDENTHVNYKPLKSNRKEFNDYYSDIMLFNFRMCFERIESQED